MFPNTTTGNAINCIERQSVLLGETSQKHSVGPFLSNLQDLGRGNFGSESTGTRSSFPCHVLHVFPVCSKPQVVRVTAWRIIASVKDTQALWNWTVNNLPHYTMGQRFSLASIAFNHNTVAAFILVAHPRPTAFRSPLNHAQETKSKWYSGSSHDLNLHDRLGCGQARVREAISCAGRSYFTIGPRSY